MVSRSVFFGLDPELPSPYISQYITWLVHELAFLLRPPSLTERTCFLSSLPCQLSRQQASFGQMKENIGEQGEGMCVACHVSYD